VAFIAGRRIGGAVRRNRARRVLREVWRRVAPSVAEAHVVIVAREGILETRTDEVETEMRELLGRVLEAAR
jgi:ribonuclease P protein component